MPCKAVLLRISGWGGSALHGGQLRSQQIAAVVAAALPHATIFIAPHWRDMGRRALAGNMVRGAAAMLRRRCGPKAGFFEAWVSRVINDLGLRRGDLVIFDADRQYGPALMIVAQRVGLRVVALSHNIEALIPTNWPISIDVRRVSASLRDEMLWLRQTDGVWAIGSLDRDILQLFGIDARLLPYAPPPQRRDELLAVREARAGRTGKHLLVLGTVHNSPTRAGMLRQIEIVRTQSGLGTLPPVIIAGYGTDVLRGDLPAGVVVAGELSWNEIEQLLTDAIALWVHQTPMSGALTRIVEALVAGVPVLSNPWGARGYEPTPGLLVYADTNQFLARLGELPAGVPLPDSRTAEAAFVTELRRIAGVENTASGQFGRRAAE